MRKAVTKRIKFTKTGKMLRRKAGHNHFNAKESRRLQQRHKRMSGFSNKTLAKNMRVYLNSQV